MRDLMRPAGIARQHDGKPLVARPASSPAAARRKCDATTASIALAIGLVREMRELQIGIALARRLEADDTGKQPAVDLRQHHMHREIGRRQAAQR